MGEECSMGPGSGRSLLLEIPHYADGPDVDRLIVVQKHLKSSGGGDYFEFCVGRRLNIVEQEESHRGPTLGVGIGARDMAEAQQLMWLETIFPHRLCFCYSFKLLLP